MRMKDFQRQRVYNWEKNNAARLSADFFQHQLQSQKEVEHFIGRVSDFVGMGAPAVEISKRRGRGTCKGPYRIVLPAKNQHGLKPWYILHEMAHAWEVQWSMYHDGHGPRFVTTYGKLLVAGAGVDKSKLLGSWQGYGIKHNAQL